MPDKILSFSFKVDIVFKYYYPPMKGGVDRNEINIFETYFNERFSRLKDEENVKLS